MRLPKGWKIRTLGEICDGKLQTGPFGSQLHANEYQNTGVAVLMPKDIIDCRADVFNAAKISTERANDLQKHRLITGDLLFSRRGDVARFALIDEKSEGSICGTGCLKARPSKNHSSIFLSYILQKSSVKTWLEHNAVGQTMLNMNTSILMELPLVSASSRQEEDKIAQILSTWDKAIEKLEALIAAKQKRKKALMQQLLTGKKRFAGFEGEWKEAKLKNLCSIVTGKKDVNEGNINGKFPFFTCAKEPTYNDSYSFNTEAILISGNGVGVGYSHYINGKFEAYQRTYVLSEFRSNINVQYLLMWIKKYLIREILREKQDGAMPYIKLGLLQSFKLYLPSIEEQQKIAQVLSAADTELETHQKQLAALKQQKKALMQQLLTGKKRVKVDSHV